MTVTEHAIDERSASDFLCNPDLTDMAALFGAACSAYAERPAYRLDDRWIDYAECAARIGAISASLHDALSAHRRKTGKQPVIALLLHNNCFALESYFVAALTGSIVFPINHRLTAAEVSSELSTSGAAILVTTNAFEPLLSAIDWQRLSVNTVVWTTESIALPIGDQRAWNDLLSAPQPAMSSDQFNLSPAAYLQGFATSGTTGKTKTVLHSHQNVRIHSLATIDALDLAAEDEHCWAHVGPMFHVGDAVFVWIALLVGAKHVFHENQFQVADVARLLAVERVTIVKLVPSMLRLMCASESMPDLDFGSLHWILTGGAAPDASVIRQTKERFGCDFIQGYGMTEATCHIAFKVETHSPVTEGLHVLPGLQLRIVNSSNEVLEPGKVGEIAITGETLFGGYVVGGVFEPSGRDGFTDDGYFLTGDVGYLDEAGKLHIVGRSKDMINVGGENVFAWEVESAIRLMANVTDCAAFPLPHGMLGEIVGAAVIANGEITEDEVKAHCRTMLASFKIPQRVHFVQEIPRTSTGKAQKHRIIEQFAAPVAVGSSWPRAGAPSPDSDSIVEEVERVVVDYMKAIASEPPLPDQPLFDAGLDSLGAIELIELFEQRFGISVSPTLLYDHPTVTALKAYFSANAMALTENADAAAPIGDSARQARSGVRRSVLTPASIVLQFVGLLVRPTVLALSVLPVLVLVDWCARWLGPSGLLLTGPLWLALFLTNTMALILLIKLACGRLKTSCELWSFDYFRWLFLHNLFRSLEVPLGVLRGTSLLNMFYRLCGASIGRGVRLYSVSMQDLELVTIGDNTIIGRDANIQPAHIADGRLVRQPIRIESCCLIRESASILGGAHLPHGSEIAALAVVGHSSLAAATNASGLDLGSPRAAFATEPGIARRLLGYLIVGYLTSAAIAGGAVFVRTIIEATGAEFPSVSRLVLGLELLGSVPLIPLTFFAAVALALYLVIPLLYFALVVTFKRLLLPPLRTVTPVKEGMLWSHWLYRTLIDVPFFRTYLRLTVGSHLTKWNFQLLGARIGARPFLAAPYTAEPELLEIGDRAMLAGNVSLYAVDLNSGMAGNISLGNSAIVANSCVLHGGANLPDFSLLGDLSTANTGNAVPPGAIAVGVPPRVVGRTDFHVDQINGWKYVRNQSLLVLLQIIVLSTVNVAGFCALGTVANIVIVAAPFYVLWFAAPGLLLVPRLVKIASVPLCKWLILGRVAAGEHQSYSWYYSRWQLIETVLWDAEEAILSQLHGMPLLNVLWRSLGAHVGGGCCIFSSSLACEYDLKEIGDRVVLHHNSLVFCHSIERHSWLFRPTTIHDDAEVGSFTIVEAGGNVAAGRSVAPHTAIHAVHGRRGAVQRSDAVAAVRAEPSLTAALAHGAAALMPSAAVDKAVGTAAVKISPSQDKDGDLKTRFQTLHEFVNVARKRLDRSNWDYLIGAAETETTYARNRLALDCLGLRPRVLRDVSQIDCSTTLFGKRLRIPVLCAPVGALENFHAGGAASVAEAADQFGNGIIVSSVTQPGLERTAAAAGKALKVFQLYVRGDEGWVENQVSRALRSGYDAFCLTIDTDLYSRRERDIAARHQRRRVRVSEEIHQARFNWRDVARIKKNCGIPLILKGIATAEDAVIALDHGVEAIYVSNHGGRQLDHGLGAIAVLPEIVEAVSGRAKILVDGAITRGTDVVKALALGADAVAVGRLYVYGLAAAGPGGVGRLFEILEDEVRICLGLLGVTRFSELTNAYVRQAPPVVAAHLHSAFPHLSLLD
jgi:glycolate oxidase